MSELGWCPADVARVVHGAVARADKAESQLRAIEQVARQHAPAGCLPQKQEEVLTTIMRVFDALRLRER